MIWIFQDDQYINLTIHQPSEVYFFCADVLVEQQKHTYNLIYIYNIDMRSDSDVVLYQC